MAGVAHLQPCGHGWQVEARKTHEVKIQAAGEDRHYYGFCALVLSAKQTFLAGEPQSFLGSWWRNETGKILPTATGLEGMSMRECGPLNYGGWVDRKLAAIVQCPDGHSLAMVIEDSGHCSGCQGPHAAYARLKLTRSRLLQSRSALTMIPCQLDRCAIKSWS